jgi:hypothetical protein
MFERIVVAYDGSDPAKAAARLAFMIAHSCGAHVSVVHASSCRADCRFTPSCWRASSGRWRTRTASGRASSRGWRSLHRRARACSRRWCTPAGGRAAECRARREADLFVAGTHGVGGFKPLLGSVSHQLVEHAPCPVLLVRDAPPADGRLSVLVALDGSEPSLRGLELAQVLAGALSATCGSCTSSMRVSRSPPRP